MREHSIEITVRHNDQVLEIWFHTDHDGTKFMPKICEKLDP